MTRDRDAALEEGARRSPITQTESSETERTRVRRSRPQLKRRTAPLRVAGYLMIVAGLAVLGWLAWQFWGTNWVSERHQGEVADALEEGWADGRDTVRTDFGDATAILHVPRWGDDYAVPVLEGSTDEVLASGIGHMEDTADAGKVGNYVISGHRVTHGEPFAAFPDLREGDLVHVETRTATYTYRLDTGGEDLEVSFTDDWVIAPFPQHPEGGVQPPEGVGKRLITLVTCAEIFHTDQRSVAFGHLVEKTPTARDGR